MEKIDLNGNSFEYEVSGKGRLIFVMLSGYGETLDTWDKIRPEIEKYGRVFSYNRLGVGGSSKETSPQCGESVIADLRGILELLKIGPPYIFIGHSIGGLFTNLFGRIYPKEICGAVLLDATHPDFEAQMAEYEAPLHVRLVNGFYDALEYLFSRNEYTELKSLEETSIQVKKYGPFPNIPLLVIAGSKAMLFEPESLSEQHLMNQRDLASMSCNGKLVIANSSGHFPQESEPELVSNTIIKMLKSLGVENNS